MVIPGPSIDCIAIIRSRTMRAAKRQFVEALTGLVSVDPAELTKQVSEAQFRFGDKTEHGIITVQREQLNVSVMLGLEAAAVEKIRQEQMISLEDMFANYLAALKTIRHCTLVGIGFEVSMPRDTSDRWLKDAEICICFIRETHHAAWKSRELTPLVSPLP